MTGADSLDTVELVMKKVGCEIPDDAAEKIVTLRCCHVFNSKFKLV